MLLYLVGEPRIVKRQAGIQARIQARMPASDEVIEVADSLPFGGDHADTLPLPEADLRSYASEAFKAGPGVVLDVNSPKPVAGLMLGVQLSFLVCGLKHF